MSLSLAGTAGVELVRDEVYEFLFLALTERIKGATGSMVRPIAVR